MVERPTGEQRIQATLEIVPGIPLIEPGDNIAEILHGALTNSGTSLRYKDVIVIAQKIISKAEGRMANLNDYVPSEQAQEMSRVSGRDPRLVEAILRESTQVRWVMEGTPEEPGIIVVKHKLGHVCSCAGIDATNMGTDNPNNILLLPEDPDASAKKIADHFAENAGVQVGVMVIDTLGDTTRNGSIGKAIGVANVPARYIENGLQDLDGKPGLRGDIAFADGLAGSAMLLMGNPNAGSPTVLFRGIDYPFTPTARIKDVLI